MVLFSRSHPRPTVPNTSGRTRFRIDFRIDFRTVNLDDLVLGRAALNMGPEPCGTSLRDFVRGSDFTPLPADVVARYDVGAEADSGVLVFKPTP